MRYLGVRSNSPPWLVSPEITARALFTDSPIPTPISAGNRRSSRHQPPPRSIWLAV